MATKFPMVQVTLPHPAKPTFITLAAASKILGRDAHETLKGCLSIQKTGAPYASYRLYTALDAAKDAAWDLLYAAKAVIKADNEGDDHNTGAAFNAAMVQLSRAVKKAEKR